MNSKDLFKLVQNGENSFVEFKHKINFPEKVAKEIVAFANTKGGKLLIGIDDNKNIFGLKNADEEIFVIHKMISEMIKFPIKYSIEKIKISDKKDVLVIHIDESEKKPNYSFLKVGDKLGTAYVRYKDQSVQASPQMLQIMKLESRKLDLVFTFNNENKAILQLIDLNKSCTLAQLAQNLQMTEEKTANLLINMCVTHVLKIKPGEKEDYFEIF